MQHNTKLLRDHSLGVVSFYMFGGIMKLHTALTIAGTDPSGGAGIMAD